MTHASAEMLAGTPFLEKTDLFEEGQGGFACYRVPGIVVTASGVALAYCEARKFIAADQGEIEIHLRCSVHSGRAHVGTRAGGARRFVVPARPHFARRCGG